MTWWLWGVYPYACILLFLFVPVIRMVYRPFAWSTRASGLFGRRLLGFASLLLHWGILCVLTGHLIALFGGLWASEASVRTFYWLGLVGGFMVLTGSLLALYRRVRVAEVRAMSRVDDYLVHVFIISIVSIALYQVIVDRIFGVAFTASAWISSLWTLSPQPELMTSAPLLSKLHVLFALTFIAYFPFTKMVHVWTYPVNFFVRPRQSMRTVRYRFERRWELALRSDKSWLVYGMAGVVLVFATAGRLIGVSPTGISGATAASIPSSIGNRTAGWPLYVSQCARCHGVSGRGDGAGAASPIFAAPPRDFTTGTYHFISTGTGIASNDDLFRTVRTGLPISGMPAFPELTDGQVRSLVDVLVAFWPERIDPGPTLAVMPPTNTSTENGAELFGTFCSPCHGAQGRGDGVLANSLPLRPARLAEGRFKAGGAPEQIYMRITAGVPPLMPSFRTALTPDQVWAIVGHVRQLSAVH